jgi:hypothetical protein
MSLSKKVELEKLKAEYNTISEKIAVADKKLIKLAVESMKKDFRDFFTKHGFTVQPSSSSFYQGQDRLEVSNGDLKAILLPQNDTDEYQNYFFIRSGIKEGAYEYNVGVYTNRPKPVNVQAPTTPNPLQKRSEAEQLEEDIKHMNAKIKYTEAIAEGLDENKYTFSVSWQNRQSNKSSNASSDNFIDILEKVFG